MRGLSLSIEALYLRYGPMVRRRCRFLLRDLEEANDALQEVFMRLLRREGQGETLQDQGLSSLLYLMATQECLNRIQRRKFQVDGEIGNAHLQGIVDSDYHLDFERQNENRSLLDRIFASEQAGTKVMAVLHFVDGFTLEETAREVGLSVSGVRKRLRQLSHSALHLREERA
jgi:RNA polymerase sigma factor (sigma-70 family)